MITAGKTGIRVLVADDCPLARDLLRELLGDDDEVRIVGEAANGEEAVQLVLKLRPDLVIMDIEMPVMSGLEAIEVIMREQPTPIMVITSHADARLAYEAVGRGALEVVPKPVIDITQRRHWLHRIKLLAGVAVIRHITGHRLHKSYSTELSPPPEHCRQAVAIAASLGGARVLETILSQLPADFPAPIVVAQHIANGFAEALAEWLDQKTALTVRLATQREPLLPGRVLIAPPEYTLKVDSEGRIEISPIISGDIYHPSADALLMSVARVYRQGSVGVILTGMGQDGVKGMQQIKEAGGVTIAQNEETSLIYNMPRLVVEQGWADFVVAAGEIATTLARVALR
ncbi:MAG TPA: chemotaxis-specific protein-glutamate methyltransferase CheB [Patescibacteria group bacterium]|nr:chemotaxis-specific protein-glutamate methyltransferase CheB [Patescibacteria group bacterium]